MCLILSLPVFWVLRFIINCAYEKWHDIVEPNAVDANVIGLKNGHMRVEEEKQRIATSYCLQTTLAEETLITLGNRFVLFIGPSGSLVKNSSPMRGTSSVYLDHENVKVEAL